VQKTNLAVNDNGHLTIGGIDTTELVKKYKTPLYVMDEDLLRENIRLFRQSIDAYYGGNGLVCYAGKVFICKAVCNVVKEEGAGMDVASAGEFYTAISAGMPAENICFHGNNKTDDELSFAMENNAARIVVDNMDELRRLSAVAAATGATARVFLRIKPGVEAHTHRLIRTGHADSKFGLALNTGEALAAAKAVLSDKNMDFLGVHCHIGSQIFDTEPFELAASVMLEFIAEIKNSLGFEVREMNLGGGFGIRYTEEDTPPPYTSYMERAAAAVREKCGRLGIKQPFVIIEPGRAVAGPAGITLYTVGCVKDIPGARTFVSVDGGLCDNPRYAMYGAKYEITAANKASDKKIQTVTLAGKCCENDYIGEDMPLQKVESGDIIAVFSTGAYNYSMSSNYNRFPRPPVVFVSGGESRVAVARETVGELLRNDL